MKLGTFATASNLDTNENIDSLDNDSDIVVEAGACSRVACRDTSGVYVCNDGGASQPSWRIQYVLTLSS
jgi:hypothetical protein